MKCVKYIDAINDLVENELDEQTAGEVNLHIFDCWECASRYDLLKRERMMYAQFLFDDEPPKDLPIKFRASLKSETKKASRISWIPASVFGWQASITEFFRLRPLSVGFTALVVFGIGLSLLKFLPDETRRAENELAKTESSGFQIQTPDRVEIDEDKSTDLPSKTESDNYIASSKSVKKPNGNRIPNAKRAEDKNFKSAAAKPTRIKKRTNSANENENLTANSELSDKERMRLAQLRNLEKETGEQIEKIELLLRSFRNARIAEGGEFYDVSYETQQAKKLLEKNAELRRVAESFESLYTEEILSQVERYLLDISNLEINPSPAKVLEIQGRVKNQNLIASLQAYY